MTNGSGMAPESGTTAHLLAARSLVFGTCNLLVLPVPEGWRVAQGLFPPEVDSWVVRGDVSWATEGRGSYRLVRAAPRAAGGAGRRASDSGRIRAGVVEVTVRLQPARGGDPMFSGVFRRRAEDAGEIEVNGHRAQWFLGTVRRGLWPRLWGALFLTYTCPQTGRVIGLQLEGQSDLRPWLAVLQSGVRCH